MFQITGRYGEDARRRDTWEPASSLDTHIYSITGEVMTGQVTAGELRSCQKHHSFE